MKRKTVLLITVMFCLFSACNSSKQDNSDMDKIAEKYVKLVLNVGSHDPVFVDAYYGPEEWKPDSIELSLDEIIQTAIKLKNELASIDVSGREKIIRERKHFLTKQLIAVETYTELLQGKKKTFDEQSEKLYDAVSPPCSEQFADSILTELDKLLPGDGDLYSRYNSLVNEFIIPENKVSEVFDAAINECRRRTKEHINLPENENFTTEYVTDKVWGAYNWYKGNSYSLIQINTDLPKKILDAVGLASHEGYPGHHVYNSLLETKLYHDKGWVEYSVYALFSPQSLIAEGSANYGVEIIFPGNERHKFEKEVLFPLSDLDTTNADLYFKASEIAGKLTYVRNDIARDLMDGKISEEQAVDKMVKLLSTRERAEKSLGFIKANGSYVITYNIGQDLIRNYINRLAGKDDQKKADVFFDLLSRPLTGSDLL